MNLALHGFLLHVFLSILNLQHGFVLCSVGEPGYLDFDNLPETNFSCQGKVIGGYYADVEAGCQMFHVCTIGQKDEIMDIKFLCLNGTVFDQETRVCERVDEVDCSKSERFYNLNLELYGNNAVTLSLHENSEDDVDPLDHPDDRQRSTSARPTTTTTTTTTTSKPNKPSTTPSSNAYSHPTGYPQHFQPQPPFPQVHTSQSKSLYDDKNGGYHHQYIFHNGERNNNQQATSYQLFSNQGVSSTTVQTPQVHQIRFSSTPSPQIIHNDPSTVAPLFHTPSSTIQTLLSSNGNSPSLINPIFHNHGIVSTTEQFSIHSNNPRDTSEYRENGEQSIRPLEAVQSTNKGKVSKLTISPVPTPSEPPRSGQTKISQSSQQQRISSSFLPTPTTEETTARSFYPTPRSSTKSSESSQSSSEQVTQHIHVLPPVQIPQLKPHQITINLPPPDIQRIVQNPSSLLPSQSRVIVTAKASVSDESGRPLNTTQLVTLPLPTIPASYDDYKEGDESFDPFYRDVPKIRNSRRAYGGARRGRVVRRLKRSVGETKSSMVSFVYGGETNRRHDIQTVNADEKGKINDRVIVEDDNKDFKSIKESLMRFRDILFGEEFTDDTVRGIFEDSPSQDKSSNTKAKRKKESLEDLEPRASKNFKAREYEEDTDEGSENKKNKAKSASKLDTKISDAEEYIDLEDKEESKSNSKNDNTEGPENEKEEQSEVSDDDKDKTDEKVESTTTEEPELDIIILDPNEYLRLKSSEQQSTMNPVEEELSTTIVPVLSTSEQSIELKKDSDFPGAKDPKKPKDQDDTPEINKEPEVNEDNEEKKPEEEIKKEKPKRKSSRIRSGGKVSSRKKETKSESDKPAAFSDDKISNQKVETTTSAVDSEAEQIDKHIFDEPESQTSKEIDTRAVGNHNTHTKSLQGGKDQDIGKEKRKGDANEYETLEKQSNKLEKDQEKVGKHKKVIEDEEETTISTLNEDKSEEDEKKVEESKPNDESETTTEENTSLEKTDYKEESSIEHESMEEEITTVFSSEDVEEGNDEIIKSSHREKNKKFKDSSREVSLRKKEKKRKNEEEEEEEEEMGSQEYSTMKSEEIDSKETSLEYHDSTEASFESTHEINADEEYPESFEDSTPSSELSSEEIPSSREEVAEEPEEEEWASDQEGSTEGVLKFTDELPKEKKEDTSEGKKFSESVESVAHDYVDDNYEPENYKERDSSDSNSLSNEKMNRETMSDEKSESKTEKPEKDKEEKVKDEPQKDQAPETEESKESSTEEVDLQTTTPTTTTTTSPTTTTTSPTTTTTSTTTTTTTTVRPTPPKLFKPISARKSYNYIPPTTTPNPVIIKPRLSLLNPKPAKPPKSYNDLAPKPVIRRFPLLTRKSATTMATTTMREEDSTEIPEMTSTEVSSTSTEASKSEENVLESKLDPISQPVSEPPKDHAPLKNKNDQDSSPSEQKSPTNLKKEDNEDFTPYPLVRLSTMASLVEETLKDIESTTIEAEKTTTAKSFTLVDVEITSTTVAPVSSTSTEADHETTTVKVTEDEASTASSTKSTYQEVTEASPLPETSTIPEITSTPSEEVESTTMKLLTRKMVGFRRNQSGFNCLEKEMYRFYGDNRDCRLFHYCSPGFTSRQVLDFRFVCEEGTAFDEETQSCRHDIRNKRCPDRQW